MPSLVSAFLIVLWTVVFSSERKEPLVKIRDFASQNASILTKVVRKKKTCKAGLFLPGGDEENRTPVQDAHPNAFSERYQTLCLIRSCESEDKKPDDLCCTVRLPREAEIRTDPGM